MSVPNEREHLCRAIVRLAICRARRDRSGLGRSGFGSGAIVDLYVPGLNGRSDIHRIFVRRRGYRVAGRGSEGYLESVAAAGLLLVQRSILLEQRVAGSVELLRLSLAVSRFAEENAEIICPHLHIL